MAKVLLAELSGRWLRAWHGLSDGGVQPLSLSEQSPRLPLAISPMGRRWQFGWPAWHLHRQEPRQVLTDFLPHCHRQQTWYVGGRRLKARQVMQMLAETLRPFASEVGRGLWLVPAYVENETAAFLQHEMQQAGIPCHAVVWQDLVWLLAGLTDGVSAGRLCLIDVDELAAVVSLAEIQPAVAGVSPGCCSGELWLRQRHLVWELGQRVWLERVMLAACEIAIRDLRRDPRRSPQADQSLYEQIEEHWPNLAQRQHTITIRATDFHCPLILRPELVLRSCAVLARQGAGIVARAIHSLRQQEIPEVWLSDRASGLPTFFRRVYEALGYSLVVRDLRQESYLAAAVHLAENPEMVALCSHRLPLPASQWPAPGRSGQSSPRLAAHGR